MNVEAKPSVYLFRMFLKHDQTCGTSLLYDFSNERLKWNFRRPLLPREKVCYFFEGLN